MMCLQFSYEWKVTCDAIHGYITPHGTRIKCRLLLKRYYIREG